MRSETDPQADEQELDRLVGVHRRDMGEKSVREGEDGRVERNNRALERRAALHAEDGRVGVDSREHAGPGWVPLGATGSRAVRPCSTR